MKASRKFPSHQNSHVVIAGGNGNVVTTKVEIIQGHGSITHSGADKGENEDSNEDEDVIDDKEPVDDTIVDEEPADDSAIDGEH